MTVCIDARDVDHAVHVYASTTVCDHSPADHCPRCLLLELLAQAPRIDAEERPF